MIRCAMVPCQSNVAVYIAPARHDGRIDASKGAYYCSGHGRLIP